MRFGFDETCLEHDPGIRHPENPDRLRAIREGLEDHQNVEYITPSPADVDDTLTIHEQGYIDNIREFIDDGGGNWDPDTVATRATWNASLASAGLAKWAASVAATGETGRQTAFSLGRPPGHHATKNDAMGFCFLNNVAIAAQYALSEFSVDSVAIIDWDVHHGNGTQDIFYDRGDVFFTSLHEHGLYPGTGDLTEIGDGAGAGTNLNIPLPPGSGDEEYIASLDQLVKPALRAFDPDVVLVSVGFDAHRHDPISRMHVSTEGYGVMAERVREYADMAGAGIAFVLEGGYDLDTLADGVCMVHEVFEGWDPVESGGQINESVLNLIEEVLLAHQGFG